MNMPNFPFILFSTLGGMCSTGATMFGLYLFETYVVHWNARPAFWVTTCFQLVAGTFDIINTTRFNQTLLGWTGLGNVVWNVAQTGANSQSFVRPVRVDDLCLFLLGGALLEPLIDQLDALPSTLLLSKLCPKGVETTVFAILAGFSNVGLSVSGLMGASALGFFGYDFRGNGDPPPRRSCQFHSDPDLDNPTAFHGMARSLVGGNLILPFLTIPLTWIFIPSIRLDEEFLIEADDEVELAANDELAEGVVGGEVSFHAVPEGRKFDSTIRSGITSRAGLSSQAEVNFVEARASLMETGAKFPSKMFCAFLPLVSVQGAASGDPHRIKTRVNDVLIIYSAGDPRVVFLVSYFQIVA